nr:MAG TPA: hypothetical protein [Inoviridae sp.]
MTGGTRLSYPAKCWRPVPKPTTRTREPWPRH